LCFDIVCIPYLMTRADGYQNKTDFVDLRIQSPPSP
jgi:hypothetical protein